jgi:adenylate cyclase
MGLEIERRFLVAGDSWRPGAVAVEVVQGYLSTDAHRVVRVRLAGGSGYLTVKGLADGASRAEFEYPVPAADAREMLALCGPAVVEKVRWTLRHAGRDWVVDEFGGANAGLVLAEIELDAPDQAFDRPLWAVTEVTGLARFANASLAERPYAAFSAVEKGPDGPA